MSALRRAGTVASAVLLLVALGLAALTVVVPRLAGASAWTILTGSMRPDYPPGTLVVTRPAPAEEIAVGMVITFQSRPGEPEVVTHRVVGVAAVDGETVFTTKGDANPSPDAEPVRAVQVRGVLWYAVPYVGYANTLINGERRQWLVYAVGAGLFCYAGWMFTGAARGARRRSPPPASDGHAGRRDD